MSWPSEAGRQLSNAEVETLQSLGNRAADWSAVRVVDPFLPRQVRSCRFWGNVHIGAMAEGTAAAGGLSLERGLYDCEIRDCTIGQGACLHRVAFLSGVLVADGAVLFNIGEFLTTPEACFGSGALTAERREQGAERLAIAAGNENGMRVFLPYAGIRPADTWLACKYGHRSGLLEQMQRWTDATEQRQPERYSMIGENALLSHCRIVRNVRVGPGALIQGADRLEDVTILSDEQEPAIIGEGVSLRQGIIGYGAHVTEGVRAGRFVLGTRSCLEKGARLYDSYLGDNSTVACCEVLNSLIFPGHQQHHNNSFLIAATVQGQSNIAAGVTAGSNHNSRSADGELLARRGFWPALCVNLKYDCRFASFTLLAKGNYPYEIDLPLPFALLNHNERENVLEIIPAYWFLYNAYALARNSWKFAARDKRVHCDQIIEHNALAPDTVNEILQGIRLLEIWAGRAACRTEGRDGSGQSERQMQIRGRELLSGVVAGVSELNVPVGGVERSKREVRILKAQQAWQAYRGAAHLYAIEVILEKIQDEPLSQLSSWGDVLDELRSEDWVNLGGQIVRRGHLEELLRGAEQGEFDSWDDVHKRYDLIATKYSRDKAIHAVNVLLSLDQIEPTQMDEQRWAKWLDAARQIAERRLKQVVAARQKDFDDPFRRMLYETPAEQQAVMGSLEQDRFIASQTEQTAAFCATIEDRLAGLNTPS